jgi:hypothetical protein
VTETVSITYVPVQSSGDRPYFICPGPRAGPHRF